MRKQWFIPLALIFLTGCNHSISKSSSEFSWNEQNVTSSVSQIKNSSDTSKLGENSMTVATDSHIDRNNEYNQLSRK